MAVFEFVLILMAIVIGLGIAEVLGCSSRLLLRRSWGPIHAVWMVTVFLHLIEVVVASWAFRTRSDWTFLEILMLVAPTAALYVAASVLSSVPEAQDPDSAFLEQRRAFFAPLALMTILYSVQGWGILFPWLFFGPLPDIIRLVALAIFSTLAWTRSQKAHLAGAVAYLLLLIGFVVLYGPSLSAIELLPGS